MNSPTTKLQTILDKENASMARFIEVLGQEQAALKAGDTDALEVLGADKTALVQALNLMGDERNRLLAQMGLPPDKVGVETWIQRNPKDDGLQQSWERLKTSVGEAKELNQLNGKLIALRLQNTQQALNALLAPPGQGSMYGPDGQPTQLSGRRIIDAA